VALRGRCGAVRYLCAPPTSPGRLRLWRPRASPSCHLTQRRSGRLLGRRRRHKPTQPASEKTRPRLYSFPNCPLLSTTALSRPLVTASLLHNQAEKSPPLKQRDSKVWRSKDAAAPHPIRVPLKRHKADAFDGVPKLDRLVGRRGDEAVPRGEDGDARDLNSSVEKKQGRVFFVLKMLSLHQRHDLYRWPPSRSTTKRQNDPTEITKGSQGYRFEDAATHG
jgi:hypothetical protein